MSVRETVGTEQGWSATPAASVHQEFDDGIQSRNPFAREQQVPIEPPIETAPEQSFDDGWSTPPPRPPQDDDGRGTPLLEEISEDGWVTPPRTTAKWDDGSLSDPGKVQSFHNAWTDLRLAAAASASPNERQLKAAAEDLKQREHAAVFRQLRAQGISRSTGWR